MNEAAVHVFDSTFHESNRWLKLVMDNLETGDAQRGHAALKGTLHTLRDRIGLESAVALGAQLPMLIRGLYYEGWHGGGGQTKERHTADFLDHVRREMPATVDLDPERAVRAVFETLWQKLDPGETAKLIRMFPIELRSLWPEPAL